MMHFDSKQPKFYHFPNHYNILDYETDYLLGFPTASSIADKTYQLSAIHKPDYNITNQEENGVT